MTDQTAPTPETGAATIDGAADALLRKIGSGRKAPEPESSDDDAPQDDGPELDEDDDSQPSDEESDEDTDDEDAEGDDGDEDEAEGKKPETYKVKVAGEEKEVTLDELRRGYMMGADYGRKAREVAEARKAVIAERGEALQRVQEVLQETGFLAQTFMQRLVEGERSIDWQQLRQANPAEYAARMQDIAQNKQMLQRAFMAFKAAQAQQEELEGSQYQQKLAEEAEATLSKIPEWLDVEVANREKAAISKVLTSTGFTAEELDGLDDHRIVVLARKAMLYDQMQDTRQNAAKKATKPVPKLARGSINAPSGKQSRVEKATRAMRTSGKTEDGANWLLSRIGA